MTLEKRYLIEMGDIISIQYGCSKCNSAVSVPIERINQDQIAGIATNVCPHCQTPSGFQPGTEETKVFLYFNNLLKQMPKTMSGRNLKLRLEIKAPE
jgi:hypothetical protein